MALSEDNHRCTLCNRVYVMSSYAKTLICPYCRTQVNRHSEEETQKVERVDRPQKKKGKYFYPNIKKAILAKYKGR